MPPKAKRGEIIEIKTLISHVMETGFRHDSIGQADPARHHHGVRRAPTTAQEIFRAELFPAIAANPFIVVLARSRPRAARSTFNWTGDNGFSATETATITVE